eukprot:TRINITY_DN11050_c0_g1_i3.p1 TRINITY_DN11050_c0_g1~~TRINITY_DN11050_c0_g1_i3.p1  ORF type:complete len:120 (+),score=18.40 TRINITY_DN11050_c0_g1_i3:89-448(+)
MIRRPPRSTLSSSSAASDVYKRQYQRRVRDTGTPHMEIPDLIPGDFPLDRPDSEWKSILTKSEYSTLRQGGTEAPGRGEYCKVFPDTGFFACRACKLPLYSSGSKFKDCVTIPHVDRCI